MVPATKLRDKFGPKGSVETFKTSPDINNSVGDGDQSKKRRSNKFEGIQAKKKQKLDCILSSQCLTVLKLLMEHPHGWIFNVPVDPVKLIIPDYFSIISNPMDLGTVQSKLLKNEYSNVNEFADDVRLTFNNALMYNPTNNWAHKIAKDMKEMFEVRWELLMKKKASKISRVEVKEGSKSSSEASASSRRFSVEEPKPVKMKSEKVSRLSKTMKGQRKIETPTVTPKAFSMKSNKVDRSRIQIEIEEMERKKCEEKARMKAAKIADLARIQIEKEEMERKKREEKARIGARMKSAKIADLTRIQIEKDEMERKKREEKAAKIADLTRIQIEKETMERTQREEKARIESRMKAAAKIADLTRIKIEKEEMERTQREEKARIEAGMKASKIAARMRAHIDLKQKRERQRLELEKMKKDYDFDENNHWRFEKDLFDVCGSTGLRRVRELLKDLGLVLRDDYYPELEDMEIKTIDAKKLDDIEEGEII